MKPVFESMETRKLLSTSPLSFQVGAAGGEVARLSSTLVATVAEPVQDPGLVVSLPTRPAPIPTPIPTPTVTLSNTILSIQGTINNDVVRVSNPDPATVRVVVGGPRGQTFNFAANTVAQVVFNGRDGNDSFVNLTSVNTIADGGNGNDNLQTGGGTDVLLGRVGNDILTDTGGNGNVLDGGDGDDNLWSLGSGIVTIFGRGGNDTIYSIVGPSFIDGGAGNDRVITNGVSTSIADASDRPVVVFQTRATPVALDGGVLYISGGAEDNPAVVNQVGDKIVVTYRDGNGTTIQMFNAREVTQLAGILGAGNDTLINNTNIDSVFYGAAGIDNLTGGGGNDILKGGGDNDVLLGRGGIDDLTGDGGFDFLDGGAGADTLRAGFDQTDVVVRDDADIVLGDPLAVIRTVSRTPIASTPTVSTRSFPLQLEASGDLLL